MKAVSLFTGAGGMDIGFSKVGFDVVWANDIDRDSCETYRANHGDVIRCGDLRDFYDDLKSVRKVDLVFGGPPCQGFSVAGKMDPNDERSRLVFDFMSVVEQVQPKAFVMENVKALGVLEKWINVRNELLRRSLALGYKYSQILVLNATEYNVPQKRERMFFIGFKELPRTVSVLDEIEKHKKKSTKIMNILKVLLIKI